MSGDDSEPHRPVEIHWPDRAKDDLAAIGDYIAADNPLAAMRWVDRLIADVERAAEMPLAGRLVPEYADRGDIREVFRRTYRIVYPVRDEAIDVLTIFEGHRLFPHGALPEDETESYRDGERFTVAGWLSRLAQRVGSAGWLSGLAQRVGSAGWLSGLAQRVGSAGWLSGSLTRKLCSFS
jgi:plasmid stabilization system protein ParE